MKVYKLTKGISPTYSTTTSNKKAPSFFNILENKINEVKDIDELIQELSKLEKDTEGEFKDEQIEHYKKIIKNIIEKAIKTVEIVEKISGKNKDKVLKIAIIKDQKLKTMLDEIIHSEISKPKIKSIIKELKGILISLKVWSL